MNTALLTACEHEIIWRALTQALAANGTHGRCLADNPNDRFATMGEVCKILRNITVRSDREGDASVLPTKNEDDKNAASDRSRTGAILNDIGVSWGTARPHGMFAETKGSRWLRPGRVVEMKDAGAGVQGV